MPNDSGRVLSRMLRGPKMRLRGFPAMEPVCNALASITATLARKEFSRGIDVRVYGYETMRHGDFLGFLRSPSAIWLLNFPEVEGAGLVRAHPRLLAKVLDLSLGGEGAHAEDGAERPLTKIDLAIYGRFVDLILRAFHGAVIEVTGRNLLGMSVKTRFEEHPGLVRLAPDRAEVFVIKLSFFIGRDPNGAGLDFVLPVSTLDALRSDLANVEAASEGMIAVWSAALRRQVMELELDATGVIELGQFSVGELSRLEQGMLIELPPDALEQVQLQIDTKEGRAVLATGKLGAKGRHKAVRLLSEPDEHFLEPLRQLAAQG